jgi:hypothetical protein
VIRAEALGPDHPELATSLNNLAKVYLAQRRFANVLALVQRTVVASTLFRP